MKAIVLEAFGGPENLVYRLNSKPRVEPGMILVKVMAASVNPLDYKLRRDGAWAGIELPVILGSDVSGIVEEVGPGCTRFGKGDEVFYTAAIDKHRMGTYAEYHLVHESLAVTKPSSLSFIEAASLPLAGCTAWQALFDRGRLHLGETILIHAGAGGVGSLAIQMAKAAGARVLATCRKANRDLVSNLGADAVIDYRVEDVTRAVRSVIGSEALDVVFDTVGGTTIANSLSILKPGGRILSIAASDSVLGTAYRKNIDLHLIYLCRSRQLMEHLTTLLANGTLHPVIDSVLPLDRVGEAHKRLEAGGVRGKVVLEVAKS
ncbi:MAG: quinone oxidoreductase family protein [Gammaproteobacteria bacterium]